jgi:uncharacterized protein YutE (UPF0331/DUF86 family)
VILVDRDLLAVKLAELADRVERVRANRRASVADLVADRDAFDLVAFHLMLAVQTCADIAGHIIADEGWAAASSLAEGFGRLEERAVISRGVRDGLSRAVGLRNMVAHGYARIRPEMVHAGATTGLADLEAFAREVAAWAEGRPR